MDAKELISETLFKLLEKKNYDDISITELCEKAGYTRMSFYRNFDSKEDILIKSFRDSLNIYNSNNQYNDISNMFNFYLDNKKIINAIYKCNKQQIIIDEILKSMNYSDDLSTDIAYSISYIAYTFFSFCDTWYKRGMKETPEEIQNIMKKNNEK